MASVIPHVLTVREFRQGLAQAMRDVQVHGPVFVGAQRKPEVVVMSAQQYEQLISDDERKRREFAVEIALATNRLEGATPSPAMVAAMDAYALGEIDLVEVRRRMPRPR